mmetsp:Transcript_7271/g.9009  ORF Transcript_7271/g.9009 Transcript_7271/m.9009 type:complete len:334 (+) Transcript_7271:9-1010(+)
MVVMKRSALYKTVRFNASFIAKAGLAFAAFVICVSVSSLTQRKQPSQQTTKSELKSPKRRLEFVHITKTGGSAIEKVGAEHGVTWGACHYMNISDVGCFKPDVTYTAPDYQSYAKTSPWHTPPKIIRSHYSANENPYTEADLFAVVRNPYDRVISEYYCPWTGFQPKFRKNTKHEKDPNDPKIMNWWVKDMVTRLEKSLNDYNAIKPEDRSKQQSKGNNEDPYNIAQKHYINQAEYIFDGEKQVVKNIVHYEDLAEEFEALMKKYDLDLKLPPKASGGTYTNSEKKLTYLDLDEESIAVINRYAAKDFEMLGYETVDKFDANVKYSLKANKRF